MLLLFIHNNKNEFKNKSRHLYLIDVWFNEDQNKHKNKNHTHTPLIHMFNIAWTMSSNFYQQFHTRWNEIEFRVQEAERLMVPRNISRWCQIDLHFQNLIGTYP